MRTIGSAPSRWLHFFSPAEIEQYFVDREGLREAGANADELRALSEQFGVGAPAEGGVEVDEVDPLGALVGPVGRRVDRVAVARLRAGLALRQPDGQPLLVRVAARGVQIYTCKAKAALPAEIRENGFSVMDLSAAIAS